MKWLFCSKLFGAIGCQWYLGFVQQWLQFGCNKWWLNHIDWDWCNIRL